ncbi:MAG: enhanced serine sensitivity protein SseB [Oscillospiraceae bacterium]|nr:enhanced serine sensitivity protein SseB [Oscillospiraceae bacterium]
MTDSITGFAPFDDWDESFKRMTEGGEAERAEFFRRLRRSMFLVPQSLEGNGLSLLSTQHGELFLPAFTTSGEFRKWERHEDGATVRTFEVLHGCVTDDERLAGIVINPFGGQLVLKRQDLDGLENAATGMTRERVEHRGRLTLEAAKYAPGLAKAFSAALKDSGMEVFEAYILAARQEDGETPRPLFLIDFNGDRKTLFPRVARAVQPHMKAGDKFELLKADYALLEAARAKAEPVYVK